MTGHKFKNAFKDADIAREPIGLMLTLLPGMVSSATIDYIKGNLLTYLPFVFKFFLQVCGWSGLEYLLTPPPPPSHPHPAVDLPPLQSANLNSLQERQKRYQPAAQGPAAFFCRVL